MDQENKLELKNKLINFYYVHKKKINFFLLISIVFTIASIFIEYKSKKNNILIAEKYVKAGIYLASNKTESARQIYEEIIQSKNKFYSILSLNTILEKSLENDRKKILNYFIVLEKKKFTKEELNLIKLKKALYLIKINEVDTGNELLKDILQESETLKAIIQEITNK